MMLSKATWLKVPMNALRPATHQMIFIGLSCLATPMTNKPISDRYFPEIPANAAINNAPT